METRPRRGATPSQRGLDQHTENFIQVVREGGELRCDVETASLAAVNAHLGNVAFRTGQALDWDESAGRFPGNDAANDHLTPTYRAPWVLPSA